MYMNKELNKEQSSSFDFLPIALERLQNNFEQEFLLGRSISRKSLYKNFATWFSFDKSKTRRCMKSMAKRYEFLEWNCRGLKVKKDQLRSGEDANRKERGVDG